MKTLILTTIVSCVVELLILSGSWGNTIYFFQMIPPITRIFNVWICGFPQHIYMFKTIPSTSILIKFAKGYIANILRSAITHRTRLE